MLAIPRVLFREAFNGRGCPRVRCRVHTKPGESDAGDETVEQLFTPKREARSLFVVTTHTHTQQPACAKLLVLFREN